MSHNYIEGSIPTGIEAQAVLFSNNPLAGALPQRLLRSRDPMQKTVVANEVYHEGTIPASASRMTMLEIIVSLGHGLKGVLPSIPGTMAVFSVWENSLE
eukprot:1601999-Amphidinium_carterae.1